MAWACSHCGEHGQDGSGFGWGLPMGWYRIQLNRGSSDADWIADVCGPSCAVAAIDLGSGRALGPPEAPPTDGQGEGA